MSSYMADLGGVLGTRQVGNKTVNVTNRGSNMDLDMMDFITLMITQMTNQGIDDTMDTSEMLNQMVQMQMIQSMVNMTDATMMNYSASLVGKEVTVGKWVDGTLQEIVGVVTGTGTKDGLPVIFVNDEYYYLSEIMAVGRLPQTKEPEKDDNADNAGSPSIEPDPDLDSSFGVDHDIDVNVDSDLIPDFGIDQNPDPDGTQGAEGSDQVAGSGSAEGTEKVETPEYDGTSGADINNVG